MVQMIKTLFHCTIKKLSSLSFNKFSIFISLFLFSCTSHLIKAEEVKPKNVLCGINYEKISIDQDFITSKNKNFEEVFFSLNIKDNTNIEDFNLLIISKYKPTPGYDLKINKIIKKDSNLEIFKEENLRKEAAALQVITYPFCLINIEKLDKFKISIK